MIPLKLSYKFARIDHQILQRPQTNEGGEWGVKLKKMSTVSATRGEKFPLLKAGTQLFVTKWAHAERATITRSAPLTLSLTPSSRC